MSYKHMDSNLLQHNNHLTSHLLGNLHLSSDSSEFVLGLLTCNFSPVLKIKKKSCCINGRDENFIGCLMEKFMDPREISVVSKICKFIIPIFTFIIRRQNSVEELHYRYALTKSRKRNIQTEQTST